MGALSQPVSELLARLNYHAGAPGRILEGWTVNEVAETRADGADDHPNVTLVSVTVTDEPRTQPASFSTLSVRLAVATAKGGGYVSHLQAVEKLLDAVETDTAGAPDYTVGLSTMRGVRVQGEEPDTTGVAIQTFVVVALETVPFNRSNRRA